MRSRSSDVGGRKKGDVQNGDWWTGGWWFWRSSNVQQGARSGMTGVGYATDYPRSVCLKRLEIQCPGRGGGWTRLDDFMQRLENEARRVGESLRSWHRTDCGRVDKPWRQTDLEEGRGWWESEREEDAQVMDDGTKGTSAVWLEGWGWDAGLGRYLPEVRVRR